MRLDRIWTICCLLFISEISSAQDAARIHREAIVVDTHNDFLSTGIEKSVSFDQDLKGRTHSDLYRMKEGGVDIQFFSIWCDGSYGPGRAFNWANREIDSLYAVVKRNPDKMMMVYNPSDLKKAVRKKKLGAMLGVEGGHMIEDDLNKLEHFYKRGVRYLTLTWNNSTDWASSAMDETMRPDSLTTIGLNEFGREIIRRMNRMGMMVDISHVGERTFYDVLKVTTRPVIASHSCAWALSPVFRNLKDEQIRAIGNNGGVIQLNFYSAFVDSSFMKKFQAFQARHKAERDSLLKIKPAEFFADTYLFEKYKDEVETMRPSLSQLIDHLDYIVNLIGVDHVGLGSDFDGISSSPKELNDVADMPKITAELLKRGYSEKDIRKILGGNLIRVFRANQK